MTQHRRERDLDAGAARRHAQRLARIAAADQLRDAEQGDQPHAAVHALEQRGYPLFPRFIPRPAGARRGRTRRSVHVCASAARPHLSRSPASRKSSTNAIAMALSCFRPRHTDVISAGRSCQVTPGFQPASTLLEAQPDAATPIQRRARVPGPANFLEVPQDYQFRQRLHHRHTSRGNVVVRDRRSTSG